MALVGRTAGVGLRTCRGNPLALERSSVAAALNVSFRDALQIQQCLGRDGFKVHARVDRILAVEIVCFVEPELCACSLVSHVADAAALWVDSYIVQLSLERGEFPVSEVIWKHQLELCGIGHDDRACESQRCTSESVA